MLISCRFLRIGYITSHSFFSFSNKANINRAEQLRGEEKVNICHLWFDEDRTEIEPEGNSLPNVFIRLFTNASTHMRKRNELLLQHLNAYYYYWNYFRIQNGNEMSFDEEWRWKTWSLSNWTNSRWMSDNLSKLCDTHIVVEHEHKETYLSIVYALVILRIKIWIKINMCVYIYLLNASFPRLSWSIWDIVVCVMQPISIKC